MMLELRVRVLDARMVQIHREEQHVELPDGSKARGQSRRESATGADCKKQPRPRNTKIEAGKEFASGESSTLRQPSFLVVAAPRTIQAT